MPGYDPSALEVAQFVDGLRDRVRRGERLPLELRLRLGITAEVVEAWQTMPDEVDVVAQN